MKTAGRIGQPRRIGFEAELGAGQVPFAALERPSPNADGNTACPSGASIEIEWSELIALVAARQEPTKAS